MIKVKTSTSPLKIFHAPKELEELDRRANRFLKKNSVSRINSVSDTCTTDENGATIGIIRVIAYK